ncbi:MAG: LAGLIDADG family homing endonuclease [Nanoarchaeota archaeon]|nr:LAGLIDADG family homing endonuclease [Nanoarchaeota archaeon]
MASEAIDGTSHWTSDAHTELINSYRSPSNVDTPLSLNLWNFSDRIRAYLNPDFCNRLFDSSGAHLQSLSQSLHLSYPCVCHLRRGLYSLPLPVLRQLSNLSEISLSAIQAHVTSIQTRSGKSITIPLPIRGNALLASLVGHVFGDGYVGSRKRQFEYSNKNPYLIQEVKESISSLFGISPISEREDRIEYPCIIGEILSYFGAPLAPKIYSHDPVPAWVLSSKKYQRSFLKAFFDDDGSVMYSPNYRAKGVNLYVIRHVQEEATVLSLLEQVRIMLSAFGVHSGKPLVSRYYTKRDGKRVVAYLNITDYDSIVAFNACIGLTTGAKNLKLQALALREMRYSKGHESALEERIFRYLLKKKMVSTAGIAKFLKTPVQKIKKKMDHFLRQGRVYIVGRVSPNRSFLWKPMEKKHM